MVKKQTIINLILPKIMIKYLQLPVHFPVHSILDELAHLPGMSWKMHYNTKHYVGDWSVIALRSPGGDPDNIFSIHASTGRYDNQYRNTPLLEQCSTLKETLGYFKCEITMARLMKLNAGAVIKEHTDHDMNYEAGEARFHIPLQTNDKVDFYISGEKIPMKEGECWYLNLNLPHRVSNAGNTDRIHLVIDCLVNDWMKEQFTMPGLLRKEAASEKTVYDQETRRRIIESLRLLDTPVAIEMANKIENEND